MNKLLIAISIVAGALIFNSCKDDDGPADPVFDYHAHIHSPDNSDKHVNDTIHIQVEFESHTGETVHHVNVRIYNADDSTEIYSQPAQAHVHETSGVYEWNDDFILSDTNGVTAHSDWVLKATVWGHDVGVEEVSETVEFHVHP